MDPTSALGGGGYQLNTSATSGSKIDSTAAFRNEFGANWTVFTGGSKQANSAAPSWVSAAIIAAAALAAVLLLRR